MPRFKLTLEYVGTRYHGWQIQKNARSVQGDVQQAVRTVTGRADFEMYGSGRTDAGVHALQQVAHLDLETALAPEALLRALNDELPADINILGVERAAPRFHARHWAVGRSYVYQISRRRTAFAKPFVWWVKDPLDIERMRRAAALFVGMRDFQSFTAGDVEETSTQVLVERLDVGEDGDRVLIRMEGSHFLWKMVRRVVGVLAEIGRGGLRVEEAARFLTTKSDVPAGLTAPPSGLFLERVFYEGDSRAPRPLRAVMRMGVDEPAKPLVQDQQHQPQRDPRERKPDHRRRSASSRGSTGVRPRR